MVAKKKAAPVESVNLFRITQIIIGALTILMGALLMLSMKYFPSHIEGFLLKGIIGLSLLFGLYAILSGMRKE